MELGQATIFCKERALYKSTEGDLHNSEKKYASIYRIHYTNKSRLQLLNCSHYIAIGRPIVRARDKNLIPRYYFFPRRPVSRQFEAHQKPEKNSFEKNRSFCCSQKERCVSNQDFFSLFPMWILCALILPDPDGAPVFTLMSKKLNYTIYALPYVQVQCLVRLGLQKIMTIESPKS